MRFLETDFASHLGGFGRHKTLPFAGLKANETNHGDLRLRTRVDAGAKRHNPGRRTPSRRLRGHPIGEGQRQFARGTIGIGVAAPVSPTW